MKPGHTMFSAIFVLISLITLSPVRAFWKNCDCYMDDWESWSPCEASCGEKGTRTRTRERLDKCTKIVCPPLKMTRQCYGGVCVKR